MTSFYSRYWPYVNAGYMLIKGRLGGRPFPWYVNYFITSKCNLNCSYCYVDINAGPEKDPSLEQIRHTIDALYRLGTRYVCLLGGEPLLHPKFEEIVDYLLAKGMLVSVNTNGTIIGRQDHVLRKIHRVAVSFEGTSEANDKDRGRGTYDKIVRNLRTMRERGIRNFCIQATISDNTMDGWEHVLDVAREVGCTVLLDEVTGAPPASGNRTHIWRRIDELKRQGAPIENTPEAIGNMISYGAAIDASEVYKDASVPETVRGFVDKYGECPMGRYNAFLDYDGTFYPCVTLWGRNGQNVFKTSVEEAYRAMSCETCHLCHARPNYQTTYLFASRRLGTFFNFARHALSRYNYTATK